MNFPDGSPRPPRPPHLAWSAAAIALVCLLNLAGWALDLPLLRMLGPGPETMKANTSVTFLFCALCLALLGRASPPRSLTFFATLIPAGVVALSGAIALAQYLIGFDFGLDQALVADPDAIGPHPGRMAPNTAVAFTLAGLALLLKTLLPGRVLTRRIVFACALAVLGLASMALFGHAAQISAGRQWGQSTVMTVPTACCFAVLGLGLVYLLLSRGDLVWHLGRRQTVALVIGVLTLLSVAGLGWEAITRLQEANRQLARVAETRYFLSAILSTAQDQESSFRRYFIAGNLASGRESTSARAQKLQGELKARLVATADRQLLHEIGELQAELHEFENRLRLTFNEAGLPAVGALIKNGEGLRIMDAIRHRVAALQARQSLILTRFDAEAERWHRASSLILPAGGLLSLLALGLSLTSLNAEAGRRRAGETRFRGIFDSTFQFIGLLTPKGILIEANQTALGFADLTPADVINRPFWECHWWQLHPDAPGRLRAAIARAASGELVRYEEEVQGSAGRVATIDFSLKPVRDDTGQIVYLVPEGRDITDKKRAARALAESEARWNFALTGSDLGVWDWNAETDEVFFSERWCTMLGHAPSEISPRLEEWTSRVHPEDLPDALARIRDHFEQRSSAYVSEHRIRAKDGSWRWIMDRGQAIARAPDGRPLRVIGTHTDITAQKVAEQDARRLQDQLAGILRFSPT